MRERKGVLTTTITRYGDRIKRLTAEVATLRTEEAAVRARLAAKAGRAGHGGRGARRREAPPGDRQGRLARALVALRERLVAIYETGTPDVLSVILGSDGYDELVDRAEYLERIHGMDEAVVGRVRDLRNQVRNTVARLRSAKNRIEAARDAIAAEEQALVGARRAVQERNRSWSTPAPVV